MQVSWCSLLTHLKSLLLEFPTVMKAISLLRASVPWRPSRKTNVCVFVCVCICVCKWVKRPIRLCFWWSHDIKLVSAEEDWDWGQDIVWEEWIARLLLYLHNDRLSVGWWFVVCSSVLSKHNCVSWEAVLRGYSLSSATSVAISLMLALTDSFEEMGLASYTTLGQWMLFIFILKQKIGYLGLKIILTFKLVWYTLFNSRIHFEYSILNPWY